MRHTGVRRKSVLHCLLLTCSAPALGSRRNDVPRPRHGGRKEKTGGPVCPFAHKYWEEENNRGRGTAKIKASKKMNTSRWT
uniref:Putative secreted protein n=1 Tax=Ixodes ricinus TaxID=34613 RepID=A0A6B0U6S2_IXORI